MSGTQGPLSKAHRVCLDLLLRVLGGSSAGLLGTVLLLRTRSRMFSSAHSFEHMAQRGQGFASAQTRQMLPSSLPEEWHRPMLLPALRPKWLLLESKGHRKNKRGVEQDFQPSWEA